MLVKKLKKQKASSGLEKVGWAGLNFDNLYIYLITINLLLGKAGWSITTFKYNPTRKYILSLPEHYYKLNKKYYYSGSMPLDELDSSSTCIIDADMAIHYWFSPHLEVSNF